MTTAFTVNCTTTSTPINGNKATISCVARGVLPVVDLLLTLRKTVRVLLLNASGEWDGNDFAVKGIGIAFCHLLAVSPSLTAVD